MKKLFTLIALGSVTLAFADQYNPYYGNGGDTWSSYDNSRDYYQHRHIPGNYQQNSQGDYQKDPYYNYQQFPGNLSDEQSQYYYQQQGYQPDAREPQQIYNNNYWFHHSENQVNISDQELGEKIHASLSSGWFSKGFKSVGFDVNNGIVNLRGSVDTLENRKKVEDSVRKIKGVREVYNHLTIATENPGSYSDADVQNSEKKYPQDVASTPQDKQINAKIRRNLSGWFSNNYGNIAIKTDGGVVVISGTVDNSEDVKKINDHLKNIEGVKSINNQLTIKNR